MKTLGVWLALALFVPAMLSAHAGELRVGVAKVSIKLMLKAGCADGAIVSGFVEMMNAS